MFFFRRLFGFDFFLLFAQRYQFSLCVCLCSSEIYYIVREKEFVMSEVNCFNNPCPHLLRRRCD